MEENVEGNLISKENPLCQKIKRSTFKGEYGGKNINGMLNSSNHKKMQETDACKPKKDIMLIDTFVV